MVHARVAGRLVVEAARRLGIRTFQGPVARRFARRAVTEAVRRGSDVLSELDSGPERSTRQFREDLRRASPEQVRRTLERASEERRARIERRL